MKGRLDKAILENSFQEIVNRHEVLRTVLKAEEGQAYQEVLDTGQWEMTYIEGVEPADLSKIVDRELEKPFDLSQDHTLRVSLLEVGEEEHVLVLVLHHIASDAWSMSVFVDELVELYQAKQENRAPNLLAVSYTHLTLPTIYSV